MAITNIAVSNFKSFKHLDLNLGRFNVVIGANAAGKSNFVEIFQFLKTLEREGLLENAMSLYGGHESILNKKLGPPEPLRMRATSDQELAWARYADSDVHETTYEFSLQFESLQNKVRMKDDRLSQRFRITIDEEEIEVKLDIHTAEGKRRVQVDPPDIVERVKGKELSGDYASFFPTADVYFRNLSWFEAIPANMLLIHRAFLDATDPWGTLFGRVGIYDIDPRAVKKPQETTGRAALERHGENLALVLKNILADPEKSRKFHNLVGYILPFAHEVGVEQYLGTSLLLKLREEYHEESLLANLLSDGTVDVVALIIALFFEDKDVVIIEEPERNIHPHLISALMTLLKDAARTKQVIVTTHSPEIVRHAGVDSLLLIARDKDGFSTVSKPAEKEEVKIFLRNDLGLDELFIQNVLAI